LLTGLRRNEVKTTDNGMHALHPDTDWARRTMLIIPR
jgi:hypothetical protein